MGDWAGYQYNILSSSLLSSRSASFESSRRLSFCEEKVEGKFGDDVLLLDWMELVGLADFWLPVSLTNICRIGRGGEAAMQSKISARNKPINESTTNKPPTPIDGSRRKKEKGKRGFVGCGQKVRGGGRRKVRGSDFTQTSDQ